MDRRDTARHAAVHQSRKDRSVAPRSGGGVRCRESLPTRRSSPLSLEDIRLRPDVDQDRDGNRRRRSRSCDSGRSRALGASLRGDRTRGVRLVRRRRLVAVALAQPSGCSGHRPGCRRAGSGDRDARSLVLRVGQCRTAAPVDGGRRAGGRSSVYSGGGGAAGLSGRDRLLAARACRRGALGDSRLSRSLRAASHESSDRRRTSSGYVEFAVSRGDGVRWHGARGSESRTGRMGAARNVPNSPLGEWP